MRTLYIKSVSCPSCALVCKHRLPVDVRIIDTTTIDGMAEAMFDEVYTTPTLLDGDVRLTEPRAILAALGVSVEGAK